MKTEHRPGYLNGNAEGLSRRPKPENPESGILGEVQNFCEPLVARETTSDGSTAFVEDGNESKPRAPCPPWSRAHLRTKQSKDKHLNAVLQWLRAGRRPPKEEMSGADRDMRALWGQYDRLLLQNEVLHRQCFDEKTGHESLQVCVPEQVRGAVLEELHDQCRHLPVRKTIDNVRKRFYWIGFTANIELYCFTCHTCGSRSGPIPCVRAPMQPIKMG